MRKLPSRPALCLEQSLTSEAHTVPSPLWGSLCHRPRCHPGWLPHLWHRKLPSLAPAVAFLKNPGQFSGMFQAPVFSYIWIEHVAESITAGGCSLLTLLRGGPWVGAVPAPLVSGQ